MIFHGNSGWFITKNRILDKTLFMTIHDVCLILVDLGNSGDMGYIRNFGKYTQPDIFLFQDPIGSNKEAKPHLLLYFEVYSLNRPLCGMSL